MAEERPDPDQLLARIREEEAQAKRGRLKIFFGASAGVGKTYAMLAAAQTAKQQNINVLVGVIETHGRAETQALTEGLELLPRKQVVDKNRTLTEFDLDAALARKPGLILIDELAHSNIAGSRHPKRWQDVEELLSAGIDVWSTMNVQHLESLNDIVGGITGIRVWETVPDHVFDTADEVVIVDLPPDDLLQRLKEGKVYMAQQAERAVQNFFRKGNLIALRELALRRTADRVDSEMLQYRQSGAVKPVWGTRESLLACVGPNDQAEKTVRSTARLAAQLNVPWHAVYVETPALQRLPEVKRRRVLATLKLAQDMGAQISTLAGQDIAETLVKYARQHNLSKVVLGRDERPRKRLWRRVLADRIGVLGADLDVIQISLPESRRPPAETTSTASDSPITWRPYLWSVAICAVTTLLAMPLFQVLEQANIVMLFLLAVVAVAVRFGRGPAIMAAFVSVGAFDFFFVAPRFSFAIADIQYLVTFSVMLVVALVIGQMTASLTYQARVAQRREDRMRGLYEMSRLLSAALLTEQVAEIGAQFLAAEFGARSALLVADDHNKLQAPMVTGDAPQVDVAIAQWSYDKTEPAGYGTDTLPSSSTLYLPLSAPMRVRGVLAVQPRDTTRLAVPEQRRLLDTCASLLAISLERIHYINVAQDTTVQMESERLRNSLLSAISHDLRTPLSVMVGLAEALKLTKPPLTGEAAEIATAVGESALRMNTLVNNLLDMARLESGSVVLNRQWQPIEDVVGSALRAIHPILAGRSVQVALEEDLPLVRIDAVLIERILINLIENAIKYTPAGTPISLGASATPENIELWVADEGPGLPRGHEEAIFNKFMRGKKESSIPGVGLGLAICRAIAQAHGGTMLGVTRPEGGARFTLRLPREEPPNIEALSQQTDEDPS
ncbi:MULTISPECIES: two-component system sensor histidine kinase KdpD [Pseudomonas]|uniref:histidine kinase n=1 Tax=Pseudomonas fluorescens TaxID=294 RepID=A0A0N7H141_PSEFL|nr:MULTISPECIES: two-component system sensor histidine kinase KdpD [Pseudomonas]ALI04884.1 sensor protein KdpD [Pseudomonas fluorescens]PMZ05606.1 two-component system sensor histidine kinase KdbD [Pseudomonas sp. FW306-02-F02-AB]PMZ11175.1 two-component system sensor histidine kinase KdbD [Pseudomonas sp. FW306-02-H06C]PMZ23376.1 two-component system sensor histidine kinase KdbD [Pseudomonas sp. FW306-02-F08-AA]PMZ29204.1 two-component system sensor histidine kinase KdbD [Pseudomonas sp. FW30